MSVWTLTFPRCFGSSRASTITQAATAAAPDDQTLPTAGPAGSVEQPPLGQANQMVIVKLSPDEIALVLAIGGLVEQGRPASASFTSRALAGWLPPSLPRHMRSERSVGPILDLMEVEPNPRTSRRATADLLAVIADWQVLALAQQARDLTGAPELINFQKKSV